MKYEKRDSEEVLFKQYLHKKKAWNTEILDRKNLKTSDKQDNLFILQKTLPRLLRSIHTLDTCHQIDFLDKLLNDLISDNLISDDLNLIWDQLLRCLNMKEDLDKAMNSIQEKGRNVVEQFEIIEEFISRNELRHTSIWKLFSYFLEASHQVQQDLYVNIDKYAHDMTHDYLWNEYNKKIIMSINEIYINLFRWITNNDSFKRIIDLELWRDIQRLIERIKGLNYHASNPICNIFIIWNFHYIKYKFYYNFYTYEVKQTKDKDHLKILLAFVSFTRFNLSNQKDILSIKNDILIKLFHDLEKKYEELHKSIANMIFL